MCINAQKYVPFPTENAQWNIFYASSLYGSPTDTTLLKYSIQGDTTINEVTYHKLCRNIGSNESPRYIFAGGLREQDKRIFFYGFGYSKFSSGNFPSEEYLLYDFNKVVGDSVMYDRERWYQITNIDSIKIGSNFRKRYQIRIGISPEFEYIIEGIGNVNQGLLGMITPILTCLDCHFEWHFICFSQNGGTLYKNPDFYDCNSTRKSVVDGLKNPVIDLHLTVSPNPLLSTSVIKWDECANNPPSTLIISDVIGKTIKTINVSGRTEIDIKRRDFAKGIYIGKLTTGTVSQAIVKIIVQ